MTSVDDVDVLSSSIALKASITYTGTNFLVVMDNATGATTVAGGSGIAAVNIAPTKALYGTAITTANADNVSAGFHPTSISGGPVDNASMFSNSIIRPADATYGRTAATVWFAMSADNSTTGREGDNVTLASYPTTCTTQASCAIVDNGTFTTNAVSISTSPQISDAGAGV